MKLGSDEQAIDELIAAFFNLFTNRADATPELRRGREVFQLVRCIPGWRISAVAWDDERAGFSVDAILA